MALSESLPDAEVTEKTVVTSVIQVRMPVAYVTETWTNQAAADVSPEQSLVTPN